jgi:hypothetical protein
MTPSEFYRKKVIGKVYSQLTVELDGVPVVYPVDEHEVIDICEVNGSKVFICNQWHKQGVPQLVPEIFVIKYDDFKNKYLFLDFDGVLNSDNYAKFYQSPHYTPDLENIDPNAVEILNKIVEKNPKLNIVISSTWRLRFSLDELKDGLKAKGFKFTEQITGITPHLSNKKRDDEILEFLKDKTNYSFVVIDDGTDLEKVKDNLIQTQMADGLTIQHLSNILKLI